MAYRPSTAQGHFGLAIDGQEAGYLQSVGIPDISLEQIKTSVGSHIEQVKGLGNYKHGTFEATYSISEAKLLWDWCNSVLQKKVVEKSGEIRQSNQDYDVQRIIGFTGGHITEVSFDKFSAAEGKKPWNMTVKWDAQEVRYEKGSGTLGAPQSKKMKKFISSNYRLDGFPAEMEWCVEFEPPKATVKIAKESYGLSRFPVYHYSALELSDIKATFSMRSRDAWLAYVQKVIRDGKHTQDEDFDCAIHFMDPSITTDLGQLQFKRCSLFKYSEPKLTANEDKVHNFVVEFQLESMSGEGFDK